MFVAPLSSDHRGLGAIEVYYFFIQALESDIGFWRPSWILLKKLKNAKKN